MIIEKAVDILLVEDNPCDAELAMSALRKGHPGGRITHLQDGDEALQFVAATGLSANWDDHAAPKLIILDLKLRNTDGLEVLEQLKAEERTRAIPVVVFTGNANDEEMRACYRLGVNSYVVKPVNADEFARLVGEVSHYWTSVNCVPRD